MTGLLRLRSIARLVLAASLATAFLGSTASTPDATASALSRWTGGIDLYSAGVYTVQKTWLWCTAADVQIIRNIVDHQADHSKASQQRYFDYMRAHDRYAIPISDGVDPAGWTAGLSHFVDGRYRLVASGSFDAALRSAVTNLRKSNLPVGITVMHGNHAWILTGFTATADPATTTHFTVTSVRVVGPLWGLQNRTYGYDMPPDTRLTPSQLKGFFTPWHYTSVPMIWENRWVSVQPVSSGPAPMPASTAAPTARPTAPPTPRPTPRPTPAATASPSPAASTDPGPSVEPSPAQVALLPAPVSSGSGGAAAATSAPSAPAADSQPVGLLGGLAVLVVVALAVIGGLAFRARRAR